MFRFVNVSKVTEEQTALCSALKDSQESIAVNWMTAVNWHIVKDMACV